MSLVDVRQRELWEFADGDNADQAVANPGQTLANLGPDWLDEGAAIVLVIVVLALLAPYADLGNTVLEGT